MRQTVLAAALLLVAAPAAAQNESRHCPREVREHYLSSGKYKGVFDYGASALGGQEQLNLNLALTFHGDLTLIADGGTVLGIEGMATYYLGGTGRNTVTGPSGGPAGTIPVILQESAAGPLTLYEPGDRSFRVAASLKGKGGVAAALPGGLAGGGAFAAGGGHFVVDFRVEQASCDFVWGTFNMLGIENSIAALRAQGFTVKDDRGTWYATAGSGTAKKMAALHGRLRKEPPPGTDRDREATSARLAKLGDEIALEPPLVRDCLMPLFREYVFRVLEEWVRQDIEALKAYRGSLEGLDKLLTQAMTADRSLVLTGLDQCTRQLHVDLWNAAGAAYEDYLARMIKSQAPLRDVLMQMNAIQVLGSVSPELREKTREAVRRFAKRLADTYLKAFTDAYQASGNNLCDPVVQAALLQAVHAEEAYVMIRGGRQGGPAADEPVDSQERERVRRRDDEPGRWAMTRSGHVAAIAAIAALAGLAAGATADGQQPTADRVVHGVKASGAGPLLSWTSVREATTYAVVVAGGDTTWSWLGPGTQVLFGTVETPNDVLHNPEDVPVQIVTATVGETYQILVTAFDSSGHAIASSGLTTFTYRAPAGSTLPSRPPRIYRRPVYDCEDLVPPAVRERHFPGAELEESSPCGVHLRAGCPWACTFRSGKGRERQRTSVNYDCQDTPRNLWDTTSKPPGARAVPSLGRAALLASEGTSRELLVYASQANCTISIRSNRDEQAVIDLARAVDAVLTPQVVGISR